MIDTVRWLVVIEIIGVAFLPLSMWVFRRLPDGGYAFAKILGLVGATYLTWIVGSAIPIADSAWLPALAVLLVGAAGWYLTRGWIVDALRSARLAIGIEEVLFMGALVGWSLVRAYVLHPGIGHTEQYMDLSILGASLKSASFPPYDPWMSGHTLNYYYFGYLMVATLIKLSGVVPVVAYNLAISTLFAFTVSGCFSIGYALTRRITWSLPFPFGIALLGNLYAVAVQWPAGLPTDSNNWFWNSSRAIGSAADYTITEFPYFSFMLADLHPHVMGLPVTLLVIALATSLFFAARPLRVTGQPESVLTLLVVAVCIGSLFTINSWDFPTYLGLVSAAIAARAWLDSDDPRWWRDGALTIIVVAVGSVALYLPFYLHFQSLAHGIGVVTTTSDPYQFLQMFGLFLAACALLLASLGFLLQPVQEWEDEDASEAPASQPAEPAREAGQATTGYSTHLLSLALIAALVVVGVRYHELVLLLLLGFAAAAAFVGRRVLLTDEPNRSDVLALGMVALGCLVVGFPEMFYLRDSFDGGASSRMNTVFKFYYQGWTLLGLAGAYGVFRMWHIVRQNFRRIYGYAGVAIIVAGTLGALYYTINAPATAAWGGTDTSLNGLSSFRANYPDDYAAIRWMQTHVSGTPVELEMTGDAYKDYTARVSAFTGLPTVMGWADHEGQWRGADPEIQQRVSDVNTIYTTTDPVIAKSLLRKYDVRYVFVGYSEHRFVKGATAASLGKFSAFMKRVFSQGGTTVYAW